MKDRAGDRRRGGRGYDSISRTTQMQSGNAGRAVVMFVDDEPMVLMNGVDLLLDAGFDVVEAQSGDEALATFGKRADIQAVVTDINMPGSTDGLALAKAIRQARPEVAIIVTSGALRPTAAELPPDARFMSKPYRGDQVVQGIVDMLGL